MGQIIKSLFTKRSVLGTCMLIILIGEPTVGQKTGLFTPVGFVSFFLFYLILFHLFEALIYHHHLVAYQVVLITFAIYSVFVTGFLNKELTEYVFEPNPGTTLIRIQSSFFVVFTFYLLNQVIPKNEKNILSIKQAILMFILFVILISLTGVWGISSILFTLQTALFLSFLFILLGVIAFYFAFKTHPQPSLYQSKKINLIIYLYLLLGIIPNLIAFIILIITMIIGGVYLLLDRNRRNLAL